MALGPRALELLLAFGFGELGLANIWLIVRADNDRALELFRRLAFEVTERQVAAVTIDGVARDRLKMQLSSIKYHARAAG